jgi:uncharacterized protein YaiI (UPF0178 family)
MPIYVDADACPVKGEVYKVARRYGLKVFVVANSPIRVPRDDLVELVEVKGGMDKADDWIAERAGVGDVVVTADIPLADRCLARGARVLAPTGREFTDGSIGHSMATIALRGANGSRGDDRRTRIVAGAACAARPLRAAPCLAGRARRPGHPRGHTAAAGIVSATSRGAKTVGGAHHTVPSKFKAMAKVLVIGLF